MIRLAGIVRIIFTTGALGGLLLVLHGCSADPSANGASVVSSSELAECRHSQSCTPENPCHIGSVTGCRRNEPICTDIGEAVPDGSACGANGEICVAGTCRAPLQVRTASGGLLDLTGTVWTQCFWGEPSPGMSRLSTSTYGPGTFTLSDRIFVASLDCTGQEDPAQAFTFSATTTSYGDRLVGWDGTPPSDLPATVTATAVLLSGIDAATGLPAQIQTLGFVDERGNPKWLFEGKPDDGVAPDGFPLTLHTWGRPGEGTGPCTPGESCGTEGGCLTWATQCFSGAPVCAVSRYAPDGTACGPNGEVCTAGACGAPPPAPSLQVRAASGGLLDLTGTVWTECFWGEPSPSMSRLSTWTHGPGTFTHSDRIFVASLDCTGTEDPAQALTFSGNTTSYGDRVVGWDGTPPSGLPVTVTATAVLLSGIDLATGLPPEIKTLRFVDDRGNPKWLFEGKGAVAPDGFPTTLVTQGWPGEGTGLCTPGEPCGTQGGCLRWATQCFSGAPVCAVSGYAPDGTACGANGETCTAGTCG